MPISIPRLLAVTFAGLLLAVPARAADDAVTLNFVNADIDAVVKAVSEMTGRNFVLDPRVKGVINIVSARPVPRSLVYPTLLSALRLQGFTAIEGDGVTKIDGFVIFVAGGKQGEKTKIKITQVGPRFASATKVESTTT